MEDTGTNPNTPQIWCEGCYKILCIKDVEKYGDDYCHVVHYFNPNYNDYEPEPCGPVHINNID